MRITNIEGFVVQMPSSEEDDALRERYPYPPKHFSLGIVRVLTDEGITGYGYGYLNPAYRERTMRALVGADPFAVERLLEERKLPSVIEHALWDVIGKAAGKPVFKLLGGYKEKVRAYVTCVWPGNPNQSDVTVQRQAEDTVRYSEHGFKGIKIRGWRPDPMEDVEAVKTIRDLVGDGMEIMVDRTAHASGSVWSHYTALKVARALERCDATWLEEPLDRNDLDGLAELAQAVDIPITGGEGEHGVHRFREILERRSLDIVQPDARTSGGILTIKKIASLAEAYCKPCILHGSNGPGLAAPLQIIGALRNCPRIEIAIVSPPFLPWEQWDPIKPLFKDDPLFKIEDGYVQIPWKPGLGLEPDEDAIDKYRVKDK